MRAMVVVSVVIALGGCGGSGDDLAIRSESKRAAITGSGGGSSASSTSSSSSAGGAGGASSSSSSTSSSSSSAGGAGGAGDAGPACVVDEDCEQPADGCSKRACEGGACVLYVFGLGHQATPALQVAGDCQRVACDGHGGTLVVDDDADVPDDGQECTVEACAAGVGSSVQKATGEACSQDGGHLCQAGACVAAIPIVCKAAGTLYKACDGAFHDYYISYLDYVEGNTYHFGVCHGGDVFGHCQAGNACTVENNNGTNLDGVCQ